MRFPGPLAAVLLAFGCAAERPSQDGPRPVATPEMTPPRAAGPGPLDRPHPPSPELYSKARYLWVQAAPDAAADWIGYLWTGSAVRLKDTTPHFGKGCSGPFYELEAGGFVCENGKLSTLDAEDPTVKALRAYAADPSRDLPYRYGESIGLVRYRQLPTPEIQRRNESDLERHLHDVARARRGESVKGLAGVDVRLPAAAPPPMPELARSIHQPRSDLFRHSTVAYTTEARLGGRGFLLTADYGWIPKDRVKPYAPSKFRGVELGVEARLPLAFFRTRARPKYLRGPDGTLAPTGRTFPRLTWVELDAHGVEQDGRRFRATREPDVFVAEDDAVIPVPAAKTPWGEAVLGAGQPSARVDAEERATWIEVSVEGGWLIAYEGARPVFATLISPGRGGKPVGSRPTLETASTPLGSFTITLKMVTATMEAPSELVHSDVPWVQNFMGPYSLHTAYWHDDWGDAVSAGCVNLSPADARWLFDFTEPRLPEGWHAVRREPGEAATRVILRE